MKRIIWSTVMVLTLVLVSACGSAPGPAPVEQVGEVEPVEEVGTPTPVSNLPESYEPTKEPERGRLDPEVFADALGNFVLRPDDLPHGYRIPEQGEKRVSNLGIIQEMGEVKGKHYIVATGRVDGWYLLLERRNKVDVAPGAMESSVELFESIDGAQAALGPEWFKVYQEGSKTPTWVEDGCKIGDECIFYYFQSIDPATNLTKLEYDVAFVYKNVVVWVMGRGLDIDVTPDYVLDAAEAVYDRLDAAS